MSDAGSDTQHQRIYIVALLFSLKQTADHWNKLGSFSPYLERNIDMKLKYTVPCWLLNKRLSWPSAVRLFPRTDFPLLLVCPKFRSDTNLSSRWNPHCDGVFDSSGPKISSVITWFSFDSSCRTRCPILQSNMLNRCSRRSKETLNTNARLRFYLNFFKKWLQKLWRVCKSQLHFYKNTFARLSACHRGHTADPDNFYKPKNLRRLPESDFFSFFGMFFMSLTIFYVLKRQWRLQLWAPCKRWAAY